MGFGALEHIPKVMATECVRPTYDLQQLFNL